MAITLTNLNPANRGFIVNAVSADLSGCETVKAAPGAGKSIYVEKIWISSDSAINITIGAGKTGAGVTATIFGPLYFSANSRMTIELTRAVKVAANTALTVDASGAGNVNMVIQGYVE